MEGLFPLSSMVEGGRVFGEEGNMLPSTSSKITGMGMLPFREGIRPYFISIVRKGVGCRKLRPSQEGFNFP